MGMLKLVYLGVIVALGVSLSVTAPSAASTASAYEAVVAAKLAQSNPWDGVWGRRDGMMITVRGNSVQYAWQGRQWPISGLRMSANQLSFQLGNGRAIMLQMNRDGTANFRSQLPGEQPYTGRIWRQ